MEFAGRLQSLTKEEEDEEDEVESDDEGRVSVCLVSFMSNVSVVCVHPLHATALCMLATEHVCMFFFLFLFSFFFLFCQIQQSSCPSGQDCHTHEPYLG